jgi:two-component system chemotaxis response regulator CheB
MVDTRVARDIVVVGASSGGVEAIGRVLGGLPRDLDAAIFVVMHTSASAPALLAQILARESLLPVATAVDGEPIARGRVRVAPPDLHLTLTATHVALDRGPPQNRMRPAIDALFRSAAACHAAAVIGVVLTGNLSDGSAGLAAIKRCGGFSIVQSPEDALFPDMPRNAIEADEPDDVVPLVAIAGRIVAAVAQMAPAVEVPADIGIEAATALRLGENSVVQNDRVGQRAPFSCPGCGGPLWRLAQGPARFRCQIGHTYDERILLAAKTSEAVGALWIAVRTLDERARLLGGMAERNRQAARTLTADQYLFREEELRDASRTVRELIERLSRPAPTGSG